MIYSRWCVLVWLVLAACAATDSRPILFNASSQALQVESRHADGQRLTTRLQPGARISLGIASAPVEEIEVRSEAEGAEPIRFSVEEVRACMDAPAACLGWRLETDGGVARVRPEELD